MPNDLFCDVCESAVKELDSLLKDNTTVQKINDTLQSICKQIPVVSSECQVIVDEYLPVLINVISTMSPEDVCSDIRLCSPENMHIHQTPPFLRKLAVQSGVGCEICELVTTEILKLLQDESIQEKVTDEVNMLCDLLPSSISSDCTEVVKEYLPEIFKLLASLDPTELCSFFGLCSSDSFLLKGKAFADVEIV